MNAINIDSFWWLRFVPVDGTCEGHIFCIAFGERLAITVWDDPGVIHVFFLRIFTFDMPEVLNNDIRCRNLKMQNDQDPLVNLQRKGEILALTIMYFEDSGCFRESAGMTQG